MTTPNGRGPTGGSAPPLAKLPDTEMDPTGLEDELGRPAHLQVSYTSRGDKQYAPRFSDPNPALRFPHSVKIYSVMTRTDDQVDAVLRSISLPILDAPWDLDTEGVKPEVVEFIRTQIGLPEPGKAMQNRRRGQAGIVFADHLNEALDCLAYGFAPFEQVYSVTFPGDVGHPDSSLFTTQPAVQLRKLAERHPSTIRTIRLAKDGGLVGVIQDPPEGEPDLFDRPDGEPGVMIPVNRLVMYVSSKKGADWTGVSVLRTAYRPWRTKEQFCRLDGIAAERNSLGLPVVHYDPSMMSKEDALLLATEARAGAEAGMAIPLGCTFELVGVSGSTPDLGPKIEQYNQAIGRASLAMFLNLGHDDGARALGDTFLAFFTRSLQGVAKKIGDTFTEHVIRDLCEWNFGPDETYPRLVPGEITTEMALAPDALGALITAKVIIPDTPLEEATRRRYRLPPADPATSREEKPPPEPEPEAPAAIDPATGLPVADPIPPGENPFKPVADPGVDPGEKPAPAAEKSMGEDVPDDLVRVPAHVRRRPHRQLPDAMSLAGYTQYLLSIIEDEALDATG